MSRWSFSAFGGGPGAEDTDAVQTWASLLERIAEGAYAERRDSIGRDGIMTGRQRSSEKRQVAREISYASSAASRGGRAMIRVLENATGRLGLIKLADGYDEDVRQGRDFWEVMVERYGLELEITGGSLSNIPAEGPVVAIANHPYGILDGLMMGHILSKARGDFRILAHRVFRKAEDLDRIILPISFDETKEAVQLNIQTRKDALRYLADGGIIGIFPGGTVSTANKPFGRPMDPNWRGFTARMIAKSEATVVPIYFDGHNSRLFQLMSHLHSTLRMGMLIKEFRSRINSPVKVVIGEPIPRADLEPYAKDTRAMMDFLREATYGLSPDPLNPSEIGFEFEDKHRDGPRERY
jgi:putative hemolysin